MDAVADRLDDVLIHLDGDERRRAALARCTPLRCTLRAGETLLLPAFWHHEVHSHAAATSEHQGGRVEQPLNVAVNFWFRNETQPPKGFA